MTLALRAGLARIFGNWRHPMAAPTAPPPTSACLRDGLARLQAEAKGLERRYSVAAADRETAACATLETAMAVNATKVRALTTALADAEALERLEAAREQQRAEAAQAELERRQLLRDRRLLYEHRGREYRRASAVAKATAALVAARHQPLPLSREEAERLEFRLDQAGVPYQHRGAPGETTASLDEWAQCFEKLAREG